MKTDICAISSDRSTLEAIFREVEKSAAYNALPKKQSLQLRLLAEELVGMLPELLEVGGGRFWIENQGNDFELHASILAEGLSVFDKNRILAVSTSGRNAAAKGIVNKIKLVAAGMLDGYLEISKTTGNDYYGFYTMGTDVSYINYGEWSNAWSLRSYRESAGGNKDAEEWDELEKSIIANLADDVIVGVLGQKVDIIVKKRF